MTSTASGRRPSTTLSERKPSTTLRLYKNASLRVPQGFFTVMEVLVRDLLKNTPVDVFEHGARFYENLLQVRTDTGHDPAVHGTRTEDDFKFKISAPHIKQGKRKPDKPDKKHHRRKQSIVTRSFLTRGHETRNSVVERYHSMITQDFFKQVEDLHGETGV